MKTSFTLIKAFEVNSEQIYQAWLDSTLHTAMTGGKAICSDQTGGSFSAWDGYISGKNISLTTNKRIVQKWRTTEFREKDEDSEITIELNDTLEGCELTLRHTHIPEGQSNYKLGWSQHYFEPMHAYFSNE